MQQENPDPEIVRHQLISHRRNGYDRHHGEQLIGRRPSSDRPHLPQIPRSPPGDPGKHIHAGHAVMPVKPDARKSLKRQNGDEPQGKAQQLGK